MVAKVFIGVDVSKKHLDIHFYPLNKDMHIKNDDEGMKILLSELSVHKNNIEKIVCESTGGYESLLIQTAKKQDIAVWLVEPKRIKAFIISEGRRSKTDKGDAQMIALFAAQKVQPYESMERSEGCMRLHALSKHRTNLKKMMVTEKLRLEHPIDSFCKKQIESHIKYLEKQVVAIETEMESITQQDSEVQRKINVIDSVPGVGKVTATMLAAGLPELGKIEGKQMAALVGVAPFTRESGMYKGKSITTAGRPQIRHALFMVALTAIKHGELFKTFYKRLVDAGKRKMVAVVAVMRKLIVIINAMVRDNQMWKVV